MTNINCSSSCIYQKDGKCSFNETSSTTLTSSTGCAYFSTSKNK